MTACGRSAMMAHSRLPIRATGETRLMASQCAIYVFCNNCTDSHASGIVLTVPDDVVKDVAIGDLYDGRALPTLFNAQKYGGILVTNDGGSKRQPGGILGNARSLGKLGVRVMRAAEAVRFVRERIIVRDKNARLGTQRYDTPQPEWVGQDDPGHDARTSC